MEFIVAVDGPAGSGKSTVAKLIANELGMTYVDTGAMYRMIALAMNEKKIIENEKEKIKELLETIEIDINRGNFFLNGVDVSQIIRTREISQKVSKVAAIKEIRVKLVDLQRKTAKNKIAILDGRDIGSVVFPNADLKVYIDASAEERAKRRMKEYTQNNDLSSAKFEEILIEIQARDKMDMEREESPLIRAKDAVFIDTTNKSIDEVKEDIINMVKRGIEKKSGGPGLSKK